MKRSRRARETVSFDGRSKTDARRKLWQRGGLVFLVALLLRLLFWQATPDRGWPYPAVYQGDVPVWTAWSQALRHDVPYDFGLPLRPPGTAYLYAALGVDGPADVAGIRWLWCLLGASTVLLVFVAAYRSWGLDGATVAGLFCAGSFGLTALSVSPNNETPYLLLVVAILALGAAGLEKVRGAVLGLWTALHAAACLLRAEHLLFFLAMLGLLAAVRKREGGTRRAVVAVSASLAFFALLLAPWQVTAWRAIDRFNGGAAKSSGASEAAVQEVEAAVRGIHWSEPARAALEEMPVPARRTAAGFVASTVALRGRTLVRPEDLEILDEAFGTRPTSLARFPFVALYGGLNFYLANHAGASGGFDRGPLESPPPLRGGAGRYPAPLIRGLPPEQLALAYPPHLAAVNEGYRLGWDWLRRHPRDGIELVGRKLAIFARGLASGLSGWNLPLGLEGTRRAVDLVAADSGPGLWLWSLVLLSLALPGLLGHRGDLALWPWLLFLASRVVIAAAFFGYVRHGALAVPVLAVLLGLGPLRRVAKGGFWKPAVVGAIFLTLEGVRLASPPALELAGRPVAERPLFPAADDVDRRLEVGP